MKCVREHGGVHPGTGVTRRRTHTWTFKYPQKKLVHTSLSVPELVTCRVMGTEWQRHLIPVG